MHIERLNKFINTILEEAEKLSLSEADTAILLSKTLDIAFKPEEKI